MASGQERQLRRRIKSVQSTKKITGAMEMIAATRCWALTMRLAAMSSIAFVIFFVLWTDLIRRRSTRSVPPAMKSLLLRRRRGDEALLEADDRRLHLVLGQSATRGQALDHR